MSPVFSIILTVLGRVFRLRYGSSEHALNFVRIYDKTGDKPKSTDCTRNSQPPEYSARTRSRFPADFFITSFFVRAMFCHAKRPNGAGLYPRQDHLRNFSANSPYPVFDLFRHVHAGLVSRRVEASCPNRTRFFKPNPHSPACVTFFALLSRPFAANPLPS